MAVSAPEAPVAIAATVTAVTVGAGAYYGGLWAMQDMGPAQGANPWVDPGGLADAIPLEDGSLIDVTTPFPGTSTVGSDIETIPLGSPDATQVQTPPFGGEGQSQTTILDFPLQDRNDLALLHSPMATPWSFPNNRKIKQATRRSWSNTDIQFAEDLEAIGVTIMGLTGGIM